MSLLFSLLHIFYIQRSKHLVEYTIQNPSFSERVYILILDSNEIPIQAIR